MEIFNFFNNLFLDNKLPNTQWLKPIIIYYLSVYR